ncbi:MAG TPA: hypothetical protein VD995_10875, partial [Azospirillum sp.]|nr:hypothetical protein [Azospirillum sp.]
MSRILNAVSDFRTGFPVLSGRVSRQSAGSTKRHASCCDAAKRPADGPAANKRRPSPMSFRDRTDFTGKRAIVTGGSRGLGR